MEKAKAVLKDVTYVEDMNAVAEGCDALVIATEWDEFKKLDLERARKALTHPILFDGRNLFDPAEMETAGVHLQEHRAVRQLERWSSSWSDEVEHRRRSHFNTSTLTPRISMPIIDVAAGLVFRDGKLLITQRHADAHLGGLWEFPGGKREPDETFEAMPGPRTAGGTGHRGGRRRIGGEPDARLPGEDRPPEVLPLPLETARAAAAGLPRLQMGRRLTN